MGATDNLTTWSPGTKIAFRFLFVYFILYIFPFPIDVIPQASLWISGRDVWNGLVVFSGKHVLHLDSDITVLPNGSGDTTWNYVQLVVFASLSFGITLIWSLVDRKRANYASLYFWLIVALRYYLAVALMGYGFIKIMKSQFPFPSLDRLSDTYGASSPMGLLWTFMGYSVSYNFFTGLGEALGGFLLFFRRTKMIGTFVNLAVVSNVVMLNFSYDVPVKLFSIHLLLINLFIMLPDLEQLTDFFIRHRATTPAPIGPLFSNTRWRLTHGIGKGVFIAYVVVFGLYGGYQSYKLYGDYAVETPLYGKYSIERQVINADTIAAVDGNTRRWKEISSNRGGIASVEYMDGAKMYFRVSADTVLKKMKMWSGDSTTAYRFNYDQQGDMLFLRGEVFKDSVFLEVRRTTNPNDMLLVSRGFHWINEYPYNQ